MANLLEAAVVSAAETPSTVVALAVPETGNTSNPLPRRIDLTNVLTSAANVLSAVQAMSSDQKDDVRSAINAAAADHSHDDLVFNLYDDVATEIAVLNEEDRMVISDVSETGEPNRYVELEELSDFIVDALHVLAALELFSPTQQTEARTALGVPAGVTLRTAAQTYDLISALLDYGDLQNTPTIPGAFNLHDDVTIGLPQLSIMGNERMIVSDENTADDPNRFLTLTNLSDWIGAAIAFNLHDDVASGTTELESVDRILVSDESVDNDPNRYATLETLIEYLNNNLTFPDGGSFDLHEAVSTVAAAISDDDRMVLSDESETGEPNRYATIATLSNHINNMRVVPIANISYSNGGASIFFTTPDGNAEEPNDLFLFQYRGTFSASTTEITLTVNGAPSNNIRVADESDPTTLRDMTLNDITRFYYYAVVRLNSVWHLIGGTSTALNSTLTPFHLHDDVSTQNLSGLAGSDRMLVSNESATGDPNEYITVLQLVSYLNNNLTFPDGVTLRTAAETYALIQSLIDYGDVQNTPNIPTLRTAAESARLLETLMDDERYDYNALKNIPTDIFNLHDDVSEANTSGLAGIDRMLISNESRSGDPNEYITLAQLVNYMDDELPFPSIWSGVITSATISDDDHLIFADEDQPGEPNRFTRYSTLRTAVRPDIQDEGTLVEADAEHLNFVGSGVEVTASGDGVEVDVPGGEDGVYVPTITGLTPTQSVESAIMDWGRMGNRVNFTAEMVIEDTDADGWTVASPILSMPTGHTDINNVRGIATGYGGQEDKFVEDFLGQFAHVNDTETNGLVAGQLYRAYQFDDTVNFEPWDGNPVGVGNPANDDEPLASAAGIAALGDQLYRAYQFDDTVNFEPWDGNPVGVGNPANDDEPLASAAGIAAIQPNKAVYRLSPNFSGSTYTTAIGDVLENSNQVQVRIEKMQKTVGNIFVKVSGSYRIVV